MATPNDKDEFDDSDVSAPTPPSIESGRAALPLLISHCEEAKKSLEEDMIKAAATKDEIQEIRAKIADIKSWIEENSSPTIEAVEDKQKELETVFLALFNKALQNINAGKGAMMPTGIRFDDDDDGCDHFIKIMMIGNSGVGKSSILIRLLADLFSDDQMPSAQAYYQICIVELNGQRIKLQIWDFAGHEGTKAISKKEFEDADGIMIVFDLSNGESFTKVGNWVKELKKNKFESTPRIMVGNKSDRLDRQVSEDEAEKMRSERGFAGYVEVSAKTKENVEEAFKAIARSVLEKKKEGQGGWQQGSGVVDG